MQSIRNLLSVGAALSALSLTLSACADAPAGPRPSSRQAVTSSAAPVPAAGETLTRREVRAPDGTRYLIESVRGADGLPREVRVTQNGEPVVRLSNEWRSTPSGFELERQQLVRFVSGRAPAVIDSREWGGQSRIPDEPVTVSQNDALSLRRLSSSRMMGAYYDVGGPCDAQARAVEAALDDWLLSVVALGGAVAGGNPFLSGSAYFYQLKKYRDVVRAESALDQCVADAGKPPEFF